MVTNIESGHGWRARYQLPRHSRSGMPSGYSTTTPDLHCSDPSTGVLGKGQRSKGRPGRRESVAREWVDPMGAR